MCSSDLIVTDPFTYIAPWTILKKVPGLTKVAKAGKEAVLGKTVTKSIEGTDKTFKTLEGGVKAARLAAEKIHWMFGADPVFKETYERMQRSKGVEIQGVVDLVKTISKVDDKIASKLLVSITPKVEGGVVRYARKNIDVLKGELDAETFSKIAPIWSKIDSLSGELADLGVLGKGKFEETVGSYLKNAYTEYELATNKGIFGLRSLGIRGTKVRKEFTQEQAKELGQINNPGYLLLKTMLDMVKDVQDTKLFKAVGDNFASTIDQPGFVKLADASKFDFTRGAQSELKDSIKNINDQLKPLFKELRQTHKADRALLSEISSLEKDLSHAASQRAEKLTEFFSAGSKVTKTIVTKRKLGIIPEFLQPTANAMKKFKTFDEMFKSDAGLQLEKLWFDGVLERNNFVGGKQAMKNFFESAKHPFKPGSIKQKDIILEKSGGKALSRSVQLQKRVEQLLTKSKTLRELDKRSLNDSFLNLERNLSKLSFEKEDLVAAVQRNKLGSLAGKYVPKNIASYLDEIISPRTSRVGDRIMGEFKFMKVVLSPATHSRNILSNRILNWWKLGIGPWRLDLEVEAFRQIKTKGKFFREAQSVGYGANTMAANELKGLFQDPAMSYLKKNFGNKWTRTREFLGEVYQSEENMAKLTAFIHQRKKGIGVKEAWLAAESATFNYAQVTPFIRKMRTSLWGVPFITFPLKATPIAAEAILKHPGRVSVFGKIKNDIKNASNIKETEEERAAEPSWIKDGFYFKLPKKDPLGRSAY